MDKQTTDAILRLVQANGRTYAPAAFLRLLNGIADALDEFFADMGGEYRGLPQPHPNRSAAARLVLGGCFDRQARADLLRHLSEVMSQRWEDTQRGVRATDFYRGLPQTVKDAMKVMHTYTSLIDPE